LPILGTLTVSLTIVIITIVLLSFLVLTLTLLFDLPVVPRRNKSVTYVLFVIHTVIYIIILPKYFDFIFQNNILPVSELRLSFLTIALLVLTILFAVKHSRNTLLELVILTRRELFFNNITLESALNQFKLSMLGIKSSVYLGKYYEEVIQINNKIILTIKASLDLADRLRILDKEGKEDEVRSLITQLSENTLTINNTYLPQLSTVIKRVNFRLEMIKDKIDISDITTYINKIDELNRIEKDELELLSMQLTDITKQM